jgi:hypothetical protein
MTLWRALFRTNDIAGAQQIAQRKARPARRVSKESSAIEPTRRFYSRNLRTAEFVELQLQEIVDLFS